MVALVIKEHPVPAVEKIIPSSSDHKFLFFLLALCNLTMAIFIFSARPLSRSMKYVIAMPFDKFEVQDPVELRCGIMLIILAIVLCAENLEKRKTAPVLTTGIQFCVVVHALFLIASCSYSISSHQTKLAVDCREKTNSDELLSNQFTFHVVMIVFGGLVIIFQGISALFVYKYWGPIFCSPTKFFTLPPPL